MSLPGCSLDVDTGNCAIGSLIQINVESIEGA